jgi:alditol oxidase
MTEHNWAGNLRYSTTRVAHPTTIGQVQELLTTERSVRALGSRHCFNDVADTDGVLLSLDRFDPLQGAGDLEITTSADGTSTVTVSGGTRYGTLATALHARGYAIHNLASLPHISVAGAIATGTHGSGDRNQGLAGAVMGIELVTATGDVLVLGREHPTNAFPFDAALVNLGALGVVTRVTLRVEPTFEVRQDVYEGIGWDVLADHLDEVTASAYSVSLFTRWGDEGIHQAWLKSRVDATTLPPAGTDLYGARPATEPRHPLPGISAVSCTEQLGVPGPWHERLPHFRMEFTPSNGDELQSEYLVPREHGAAAVAAVRSLREHVVPLLQVNEIRTMAADGQWLSPSGDHDALGLHFTWLPDQPAVEALLPRLEEALAPFDARPHWGKLFTTPTDRLAELYPRLTDFRDLTERLDPHGVLRNPYLDRVLPRR